MTTFTVNTTADIDDGNFSQLSLREAVNLANATIDPDVVAFAPALQSQTLVLTGGELVLTNDVTIHGGGVTLDDNADPDTGDTGGHRIFNISGSGTDVSLDNLTLTRGSVDDGDGAVGGAILLGGGSLAMTGCTVSNNTSFSYNRVTGDYSLPEGGGIYASPGSRLTVSGCSITDNYSAGHYAGWGGGISGTNAAMTIRDTEFSGNVGYYGAGAVHLASGSLTIEHSTIKGIGDDPSGGEAYGGALLISSSTAVISHTTISDHDANYGGAIFTQNSRLAIVDSTIANNTGSYRSTIKTLGYGSLVIRNSTIPGNVGEGSINAGQFDLELSNSIVAGNTRAGNPTATSTAPSPPPTATTSLAATSAPTPRATARTSPPPPSSRRSIPPPAVAYSTPAVSPRCATPWTTRR